MLFFSIPLIPTTNSYYFPTLEQLLGADRQTGDFSCVVECWSSFPCRILILTHPVPVVGLFTRPQRLAKETRVRDTGDGIVSLIDFAALYVTVFVLLGDGGDIVNHSRAHLPPFSCTRTSRCCNLLLALGHGNSSRNRRDGFDCDRRNGARECEIAHHTQGFVC